MVPGILRVPFFVFPFTIVRYGLTRLEYRTACGTSAKERGRFFVGGQWSSRVGRASGASVGRVAIAELTCCSQRLCSRVVLYMGAHTAYQCKQELKTSQSCTKQQPHVLPQA